MFKHNFTFDPTYGYTRDDLLAVGLPESPDDFDTFWQQTYAETRDLPLNATTISEDTSHPDVDVFEITFDTLDELRIGGWIVAPKNTPPTSGFIIGHGYGGREAPDLKLPIPNAAAIFPCAPGFHKSRTNGIPNKSAEHVVYRIDHRESYIIRHSAATIWSAASVLHETYRSIADRLYYIGGSFGGGLGALALPWDPRFRKAHLRVPTFGHHPIRLESPCEGSGESARRYYTEHPEVIDVLQYFDAATAASHITIPVLGAPALFDPKVPPPGQFAVCNALSDMHILSAGHFEYPDQAAESAILQKKLTTWFAA